MPKKTFFLALTTVCILFFIFSTGALSEETKNTASTDQDKKEAGSSSQAEKKESPEQKAKEKSEKSLRKRPKVITNEDLEKYRRERLLRERDDTSTIYRPQPIEESMKQLGVDQKDSYRYRYQVMQESLLKTEEEIKKLQERRIYYGNPYLKGLANAESDKDNPDDSTPKTLAELDKRLDQLKKSRRSLLVKIESFKEEARKKGIPHDWYGE